MRFAYKPSPHIKTKVSTASILNTVLFTLVLTTIYSIVVQYIHFGINYAVRGLLVVVVSCVTAFTTNVIFHLIRDKKFNIAKIMQGAPLITALILALSLPVGMPLYGVFVAAIFAEFFAKLIFGGFGNNIFNPAAVGIVIAGVAFYGGDTPLASIAGQYNWRISDAQGIQFIGEYGGLVAIFLGSVRGAIGETARLVVLIACLFLVYKKMIDWVIPVFFMATIFVATFLFSLYLGVGLWYPLLHMFSGSLIFGMVFTATDPVTTPVNRQGRILFAIFLAMITLIIRFNAVHIEAMAFAILIMNMFVPFIDQKTANVTITHTGLKVTSICVSFVCAVGFTIGLSIMLG